MMPHALQTDFRELHKLWAMQHFRNEVWNTILYHGPGTLPESAIEEIENNALADAEELVSRLSKENLRDRRYMNIMICDAISDTKDRLRKAVARQGWIMRQRRKG